MNEMEGKKCGWQGVCSSTRRGEGPLGHDRIECNTIKVGLIKAAAAAAAVIIDILLQ